MKKKTDRRAKLLVAILNKEDEEKFAATVNKCCTAVHFSGIGHGTARSSYMTYFGFNEIDKRMTLSGTAEDREKEEVLNHMLLEQLLERLGDSERNLIKMPVFI